MQRRRRLRIPAWVAATPGPGRDENHQTLKVLANCERLIRQLLQSFTLDEDLIPGVGATLGWSSRMPSALSIKLETLLRTNLRPLVL